MATAVVLPRLGNTVESCLIVKWNKSKGEQVQAGEPLVEIETDKSVMEIEAPASGILLDIFFQPDADVPVMTNIAVVGEPGEDTAPFAPITSSSLPPENNSEIQVKLSTPHSNELITPSSESQSGAASPRAKQLAAKSGLSIQSIPGTGPNGRVIERDIKRALITAPHLSLSARAAINGGNLHAPEHGSGPGGMVLKSDLGAIPALSSAKSSTVPHTVTPVKGVRKVIAERMRSSLAQTAQLTMNTSAKALALKNARKKIKQLGAKDITLNDMVIFAASRTLMKHLYLNAHFLGDRILQFSDINIGFAVDTDRGLMVPNVKRTQSKSIEEISDEIKTLAKSSQAGNINPDHLQNGTFTISNLGALGIESFTPVLNAPEVAILGVGGLVLKPFENDGEVEFIPTIGLSLTIDHQATDGAPAARFLKDLVEAIETFTL